MNAVRCHEQPSEATSAWHAQRLLRRLSEQQKAWPAYFERYKLSAQLQAKENSATPKMHFAAPSLITRQSHICPMILNRLPDHSLHRLKTFLGSINRVRSDSALCTLIFSIQSSHVFFVQFKVENVGVRGDARGRV